MPCQLEARVHLRFQRVGFAEAAAGEAAEEFVELLLLLLVLVLVLVLVLALVLVLVLVLVDDESGDGARIPLYFSMAASVCVQACTGTVTGKRKRTRKKHNCTSLCQLDE